MMMEELNLEQVEAEIAFCTQDMQISAQRYLRVLKQLQRILKVEQERLEHSNRYIRALGYPD